MTSEVHATTPLEIGTERLRVGVLRYGARLAFVRTPDRNGVLGDVSVGFDDDAAWRADTDFHGATIGRFTNRIAGGTFSIDGEQYAVPLNEPTTALHGGPQGFSQREWTVLEHTDDSVQLGLTSPDGEMGFPGTLEVTVRFTVAADGDGAALQLDYRATTDAPTLVSLTNHVYLNLAGRGSVADHVLQLHADRYLPVGDGLVPTGELAPVDGTPFDFREPTPIGTRWREPHPQLQQGRGYDHAMVLADGAPFAARLADPVSGRTLTLTTDQPAVQLYTGGMLDGTVAARSGLLRQGDAVCLEAGGFPDAPHHDDFPSAVLRPGQEYRQRTSYRFGTA